VKVKKDNTAKRARTEANKKRELEAREWARANAKQNPATKDAVCGCGLVVKIKKYKIKPDYPYTCSKCRRPNNNDKKETNKGT
jgi:hypothetical protein